MDASTKIIKHYAEQSMKKTQSLQVVVCQIRDGLFFQFHDHTCFPGAFP